MLRPEQMSKVSVTGSRAVMESVIETMHEMHMVHITDYDGSWEGFEPGDPLPGSDETSSTLVTVRSIESILDIDGDDVASGARPDLSNYGERLEEVRTEVNDLDERRDERRNRLRELDERRERLERFASLGLELDLLWGYDSLDVLVGEGDPAAVETALASSDAVEAFDVFGGGDTVAIFGYMSGDEALSDALVGVPFTAFEVPEETGDPEAALADLESERKQVKAELEKIESELEALKADSASFLLALEEELSIDAQKYEAPLRFATTERSFIVEGWVPADRVGEFESSLRGAVGERIEIEEMMTAAYTSGGHLSHDPAHDAEHEHEREAATDGGTTGTETADGTDGTGDEQVATDGGVQSGTVTVDDDPPVVQENPGMLGPFELLTKAVNRPKYSEFDPTFVLFLTFPLFFGFMIGDIGYGLLYMLIGYGITSRFEADGIVNFGTIVIWLGLFTAIFGVLYGEVIGLHFFEWVGSEAVIHKGLSEPDKWAKTWLVVAVVAGWVHLDLGYLFELVEEYQLHGPKQAVVEVGSWLLMLNGLWVWIFSYEFQATGLVGALTASGPKPGFLVGSEALLASGPLGFGFEGFPAIAGILGLAAFVVGILILVSGPWYEVFEFAVPLAHVLSYTRLTAVLLAKAGMALAANLLYWGVYKDGEGFHYLHTYATGYEPKGDEAEVVFRGLANMGSSFDLGPLTLGLEGALIGIPVFVVAHAVVLAVGGTAAIQAIRLEYFEFFEKFYEGGGKNYQPFGYDRTYTTDN